MIWDAQESHAELWSIRQGMGDEMKHRYTDQCLGILLICAGTFLVIGEPLYASPDIPEDNLSYPVLLQGKNSSGSGFFYNKEDATYLITARHVLFKGTTVAISKRLAIPKSLRHKLYISESKPSGQFILEFLGIMSNDDKNELIFADPDPKDAKVRNAIEELYNNSQDLKLQDEKLILRSAISSKLGREGITELELDMVKLLGGKDIAYHPSHDVAYIKMGFSRGAPNKKEIDLAEGITKARFAGIVGVGKDHFKLLDDVIVGNQVVVFGYPLSITKSDPWLDIGMPLLRKGVVAGINKELKAIILDSPAYKGNSGGLVIEIERVSLTEVKYRAIGVVTNLVPYRYDWVENSGYSVAVPMDFVEELLEADKGSRNH